MTGGGHSPDYAGERATFLPGYAPFLTVGITVAAGEFTVELLRHQRRRREVQKHREKDRDPPPPHAIENPCGTFPIQRADQRVTTDSNPNRSLRGGDASAND